VVELQPGYLLVHCSKLRGSNFFCQILVAYYQNNKQGAEWPI
jgi:hypothetical protein